MHQWQLRDQIDDCDDEVHGECSRCVVCVMRAEEESNGSKRTRITRTRGLSQLIGLKQVIVEEIADP